MNEEVVPVAAGRHSPQELPPAPGESCQEFTLSPETTPSLVSDLSMLRQLYSAWLNITIRNLFGRSGPRMRYVRDDEDIGGRTYGSW
jgi:hypothetical protein